MSDVKYTRLNSGVALIGLVICAIVAGERASAADQSHVTFFENKVRPVLADHCYECNGPSSSKGKAKLRVDSLKSLLHGGTSGPANVPGEPDRSLLILAVRHDCAIEMPPKTKLEQDQINALAAWVKLGAPWPDSRAPSKAPTPSSADEIKPRWDNAARAFSAFQPIKAPTIPRGILA
jgi:hypothetical protein